MADEPKKIPNIRTFKTDAEIFIKERKLSELDIARSSYAAGGGGLIEKIKLGWDLKKIAYFALGALALALFGYFSFNYFFSAPAEPPAEAPKAAVNFLPVDDKKELPFSEANPGALLGALLVEKQKQLRFDTVVYFPLAISAQDFARLLSWSPPSGFLENLNPEFNTLIVYGQPSGDLAVIFKAKNFPSALASLFNWERTIWQDFKPFLQAEDIKNISQFAFADDLIKNNDARVLKNPQGKIILGYSIFNKQYIIISASRDALSTILERLIALPPR